MSTLHSAIAAHRFGLGEAEAATVGADAAAWLTAQIGAADAQTGALLAPFAQALAVQQQARRLRTPEAEAALREQVQADLRARLATAAATPRPFAERLALFWANHFTVSLAKGSCQGLVGCHEREAIRPHIAGRFADLLQAAVSHPVMLRYLDNNASAGPQSRVVQRLRRRAGPEAAPRLTGLNENLAREVLELHTLGVQGGGGAYGPWGGYSQADVGALAAILTGWRGTGSDYGLDERGFDASWHQPGDKQLLGRRYGEGPQALQQALQDLARHPSTARHLATKLARHFVADVPPLSLVERLARIWSDSDGHLTSVYQALIASPEAWQPGQAKLRTPEEFVIAALRLLQPPAQIGAAALRGRPRAADLGLAAMGQRPQSAPSPAGWPDRADEWLGPEALWQRLEWSQRLADQLGHQVDARALARASLGPLLGEATRQQIERAADGRQALALLLMAPEFQRR